MQDDIHVAAAKAVPPVTVSVFQMIGTNLPEIILWLTAIYTVLQIVLTIRRLFQKSPDDADK